MIKSTRNAHSTALNPYQGKDKKVLTVCTAGVLRSPTAANVLRDIYGYNTRSCGIDESFALIPISTALVDWADEIVFVHDEVYKYALVSAPPQVKEGLVNKAIRLDIPDQHEYMSEELQYEIRKQYVDATKKKNGENKP